MTKREMKKLRVMDSAISGNVTVKEAAGLLGLSERQVLRLKKGVLEQGAAFVIHKKGAQRDGSTEGLSPCVMQSTEGLSPCVIKKGAQRDCPLVLCRGTVPLCYGGTVPLCYAVPLCYVLAPLVLEQKLYCCKQDLFIAKENMNIGEYDILDNWILDWVDIIGWK